MENRSRFIEFINKHEITPGLLLLICVSFWFTVVALRGIIFWSVLNGAIPEFFIEGYHIHHFISGFLLLIIAIILMRKPITSRYIPLVLLGSSLGFIFDEFLFWTRGHFDYWSRINLLAVVAIGTAMMIAYLYAKRHHLGGQISKRRVVAMLLPILIFSSLLTLLFHYHKLLGPTYAQQRQALQLRAIDDH